ncbi:hypothetical protein TRVL_06891 [Trypanosoma vivax]|uniref:Uncharacterized protein n=1 Tax=Trypanosoma vivax (strain Y486) TaxID=1055687 RepID=G0U1R4_TRYVY|nr:hypothetical protein TRVL_06891 [Trypanosoma vivax]CCC50213.1 hypothetical protein, unlikely [Trypanosoma vivax Y486]
MSPTRSEPVSQHRIECTASLKHLEYWMPPPTASSLLHTSSRGNSVLEENRTPVTTTVGVLMAQNIKTDVCSLAEQKTEACQRPLLCFPNKIRAVTGLLAFVYTT